MTSHVFVHWYYVLKHTHLPTSVSAVKHIGLQHFPRLDGAPSGCQCAYVCVHTYAYTYTYAYMYIYIHTYTYTYTDASTYTYTYAYAYIPIHMNIRVGGLEHVLLSIHLAITIPIDELIFFRGVGIPPTR